MIDKTNAASGEQNLDHLEALAPCPFCGSAAQESNTIMSGVSEAYIECVQCGISTKASESRSEVIREWNRRAAPVSAPIAVEFQPVWQGRVARRESIAKNPDAMLILTQGYPAADVVRVVDGHVERQIVAALANQAAATAAPAIPTGEQLYTMVTSRFKSGSFPWAMVADSGKAAWSAAAADLIFSPDTIAARLSQPSEAAPLRIEIQDGGSGSWPIGVHDADGDLIARFSYKCDAERFAHQPAQEQAEPQKGAATDYGTPSQAAQHEAGDERVKDGSLADHDARFAIDAAIMFGRENVNKPPSEDHWLYEYWSIGRQLAELGKTSAWDNVTPVAGLDLGVASPVVRAQSEESIAPTVAWTYDLDPPQGFVDYVSRNYTGNVFFSDPAWHARRLWNAAMRSSKSPTDTLRTLRRLLDGTQPLDVPGAVMVIDAAIRAAQEGGAA